MISVKVKEVVLDQTHNPLLLLVDTEENCVLPIGIGFWEAQAIILKLQGNIVPRPMTHDLMSDICNKGDMKLEKVVISDIIDNTFYSELYFTKKNEELIIDSRPSDAVALALTVGVPIYISDKVAPHTLSIEDLVEEKDVQDSQDIDNDEGGPHLH